MPQCFLMWIKTRSSAVSVASVEEESRGEASPFRTPSGEWDETPLIFTVRKEINMGARGAPTQAWSSQFLDWQVTRKPIQFHSVNLVHLEAGGIHINRHVRLQNQPSHYSKGDSVPPGTENVFVTANGFPQLLKSKIVNLLKIQCRRINFIQK